MFIVWLALVKIAFCGCGSDLEFHKQRRRGLVSQYWILFVLFCFLFYFLKNIYLLHWILVAACEIFLVAARGI